MAMLLVVNTARSAQPQSMVTAPPLDRMVTGPANTALQLLRPYTPLTMVMETHWDREGDSVESAEASRLSSTK